MRYQRAKVNHHDIGVWSVLVSIEPWQDCPDTDIPHTVLEAFKHFPNEPVVIAGWAYRVID
jgi:hypothetical protein